MPIFLKNMSFAQFHVFMEEYAHTDGNYSNGNKRIIQMSTSKKNEADLIQEICHTNGSSCKVLPKKNKKTHYMLYINLDREYSEIAYSRNIKKIPFEGRVFFR